MDELLFQPVRKLLGLIGICEKTRLLPGAWKLSQDSQRRPDRTKPGADALAADQRLTGFKD